MKSIWIGIFLLIACFISVASDYTYQIKKIDSFITTNQIDSASVLLSNFRRSIRSKENPISLLAYYDRCANVQKHIGSRATTLSYYDSISGILPFVRPLNGSDSMLVARGYFCVASIFSAQNKYSESIEPFRKALLFSESEPDNQFRSYYYQNIGLSYIRIGQVEEGLMNVNIAFSIYDANKDIAGKFGCLDFIGNTMVDYRNFELARKYFKMALSLKDSIKNEFDKSGLFNDIGRMFNYETKYDSALVYFDLALAESKQTKNNYLIAIAQCNIGEILMKQCLYDKAIAYLYRALNTLNAIHFDLGIFQANHLIAFCEYKKHDLQKSEFFQNKAEELLKKTEVYPTLLIDFYKRSYELKKGIGKIKESLDYLEKYQCMQDSVNGILTNWKVNELESRLLTDVKEKQLIQKESISINIDSVFGSWLLYFF